MPPDDELEFDAEQAPRLLAQACALLKPPADLGGFEELLERNALPEAWDALAAAAKPAPEGFWALMTKAARELKLTKQQHWAQDRADGFVRLKGDFNGLFEDLLCLSHTDTCTDEDGNHVPLREGMHVTAYDPDDRDDDLIATGVVEAAPDWLSCKGSKWVLRIDFNGVRHQSDR